MVLRVGRFSEVGQDSEFALFRYAQPRSLFWALEVSCGENFLVLGGPPMRPTGGTQDKFIAVIEDYNSVGGVGGGGQEDTHNCAER
jgi:hypothetical protein